MVSKVVQNTITGLFNKEGFRVHTQEDIENEVITFYNSLLGSSATRLPHVNVSIMRLRDQ